MSFVAAAIGAVAVGAALYTSDKQRSALHKQQDAVNAAQAEDKRQTAQAEIDSQLAANQQVATVNRRRRNNALALGDPNGSGGTLGGTTVLGAGSGTQQVGTRPATSVLGSGA